MPAKCAAPRATAHLSQEYRTPAWEQRKLGELFEEHSEKDRDDLPALTIIQGGGTVHRDESNRNLQFDRNSLSNYKVVDTGDFIVHLRSFEGGLEKATCCGLVSPAYHIFRGKNVDSDFYYLYFRSKRFIDADLKPHVYGIRDGRSIDIEGMKTIFIPWTNLAEQRRIGAFFDHLDSLITLHQRKYDKLCVLKKSMLDKMFPKGGSLYPEIRFAGFTDPWEQRKLGELTEIKDSARIPNRLWREAGVPYIRASDISQEDLRGALFIDEEDYAAYKAATGAPEKGDVLFNGGGEIGKAIINGNSSPIYVQGGAVLYARIAHSSLLDARYLVAAFVTQNVVNAIGVLSAGGTMKHFTLQPAKNLPIEVPSIAEQRRIGAFFDRLDSLITLHQRKYCGVVSWMLGVALVRLSSEK